jgi:hypothetical protein
MTVRTADPTWIVPFLITTMNIPEYQSVVFLSMVPVKTEPDCDIDPLTLALFVTLYVRPLHGPVVVAVMSTSASNLSPARVAIGLGLSVTLATHGTVVVVVVVVGGVVVLVGPTGVVVDVVELVDEVVVDGVVVVVVVMVPRVGEIYGRGG